MQAKLASNRLGCAGFGFDVYQRTKAWLTTYSRIFWHQCILVCFGWATMINDIICTEKVNVEFSPTLSFCSLHLWGKSWDLSSALIWPSWSQSCLWRRLPPSPLWAIVWPSLHCVWSGKYPESALPWPAAAWTTQKLLQCVVNNRRGRFGFEYRERNGCASTYSTNWLLAAEWVPAAA